MTKSSHVDIAAYALGVLDEPDNQAFEEHLFECSRCQFELAELQDVAAALEEIRRTGGRAWRAREHRAQEPDGSLESLLDRASSARRRSRRALWLAAAAAVALIIAGPLVTVALLGGPGRTGAVAGHATTAVPPSGTDRVAALHSADAQGTVTVQDKEWGASVDLELRGVLGPRRCQLVAVSHSGAGLPVTSWIVPPKGYGVPGSPDPLRIHAGVGLTRAEIERFEVRTDDGAVLVSVAL